MALHLQSVNSHRGLSGRVVLRIWLWITVHLTSQVQVSLRLDQVCQLLGSLIQGTLLFSHQIKPIA